MKQAPFVLIILDGWGYSKASPYNAISQANTPFMDGLLNECPNTLVDCSGHAVGLPDAQIGNSEVGHLHIGAGRVMQQSLSRINDAIASEQLSEINTLVTLLQSNKRIHLIGLLSTGGVHSHEDHFGAVINLAKKYDSPLYVHAFLDGRDTPPKSGKKSLVKLQNQLSENMQIASISGRYYAMDRNDNWDRTKKAYDILTKDCPQTAASAIEALEHAYARNETDEFVQPTHCSKTPILIGDDDIVIFMNFRADRARALTSAFIEPGFNKFETTKLKLHQFVSMTKYADQFTCPSLFPPIDINHTLGEIIANLNLKQLRIAETEKYAHVTYFFNGGKELPFINEKRILVPSPDVATYDLQPEMSAQIVTDQIIKELSKHDIIICNYANADMVGHTGNIEATIKAVETLDSCLQQVMEALKKVNGTMLITADHGNAESMYDDSENQPHTAHTNNLVPCILTNKNFKATRDTGRLIDIAPSILSIIGHPIPNVMTGKPLFIKK